MSDTQDSERPSNPRRTRPENSPRTLRWFALRVVATLDLFGLAAVAWTAGYIILAASSPRGIEGHATASDLLLLPTGPIIGLMAFLLAKDKRLPSRDRLPWRLIAAAGLCMPIATGLWALADGGSPTVAPAIATAAMLAPLSLLGLGALSFRTATDAAQRPRPDLLLDLATVILMSVVLIWFLILDPLPAPSGTQLLARGAGMAGAVLAIGLLARIGLRPMRGLSSPAAALLVAGGGAAIVGALAIGLGPVGDRAASIGQVSFALLPCGLMLGARMEMLARTRESGRMRRQGPSPLFYAAVAIGSGPLTIALVDLGSHDLAVVVWCLAMTAIIAVRQIFTVRQAVIANRLRTKTEARFGWLVMNSSDLIMAVDGSGAIDYVSPSVERLLIAPDGKLLGTRLTDLAHPDDVTALADMVDQAVAIPGRRVVGEWRLRQGDGTWLPVETVATSGMVEGDTAAVVLNTRDLQERKALEQKLTFQAFHDPLTRLANRTLFRERVEHSLDRRGSSDNAVLFIDLDNFKTINDSLGHAAGDHVLVETAHRLRSALRSEDTAARLGGDEFGVLLEDAGVTDAARVAERIRTVLGVPFWVLGQEVFISASIGIATREIGDTATELLRNADVAMYTAKTKGKARFEIFEPRMHDVVVARLGLEAELRRAIDRQEFVVYYQPIVSLQSGEVTGAEALVRWQHPTRGLLAPLEFIPLAEETGLIVPLGAWILRQACRQLAEWQALRGGGEPFVMSVNLSSRQLVRDVIADEVAAAVDESGIRASWLVLEVTETVLMADPVVAATALAHIRDLGVRVALDDFGSGYSSLSHLRRFPIDIVKIDKSFVDDVTHEGSNSAIARGIIDLGRAMNIQTVAEGIEQDEQAETLRALGCELGQGYYLAKPLDAASWAGLLRADQGAGTGSGEVGSGEVPAARAAGRPRAKKSHKAAA
jgi:diguanylate cyclase (GGDEF)-like protein/PAS domain S-box-containing protein